MSQITIRSDRKDDYTFYYKGDEVTLGAGKIISIATGLDDVVLPTCAMKIINNLIVIKEDVKHKHHDEEEKQVLRTQQRITPIYEVGTNIVTEDYVRSKALHQCMKQAQILSQRTTYVVPNLRYQ